MYNWWQTGIVYQIYPRSYQDTNGDGIGDLQGITKRLGYLQWLGIDAIWISPIFPSPMADFGYDVSNYVDIDPMFGSIANIDTLIAEAHKRDIKIILDFVANHTSEEHAWFQESKSSRDNPKRDWYLWMDAKPDGSVPNNWTSVFGGKSGWEWDEATEQYYFHSFLKEQPDVNWRNPELRKAMLDSIRFWYDRGVDGFRVDAFVHALKDPDRRDNPLNPEWEEGIDDPYGKFLHVHSQNTPHIHTLNRWLRETNDEYEGRLLIGEGYMPVEDLMAHYGAEDEYHLPFNFQMIDIDWDAEKIRAATDKYDGLLPEFGWPSWVMGNHDRHRIASRAGVNQSRVAMMMLLTLRGTPTMYYGDELGMEDVHVPPEKEVDPAGILAPGLGLGRDPERTPMQWDGSPNAGFANEGVTPWLPVEEGFEERNVDVQLITADSHLRFTKTLIDLRREHSSLAVGSYKSYDSPEGTFVYSRTHNDEICVVMLNLTDTPKTITDVNGSYTLLLSTFMDQPLPMTQEGVLLHPNEGLLLKRI